jgi:hypothetical protein
VPNDGMHAVVEAFDINSNDAIEVFLGRALNGADMRDASVVDEYVNALTPEQVLESSFYFRLVRHITRVGGGSAACGSDSLARAGRGGFIDVQNSNHSAVRRELQSNGLTNATTATGDRGDFAF